MYEACCCQSACRLLRQLLRDKTEECHCCLTVECHWTCVNRAGTCQVSTMSHVLSRGGDTVVSSTRCTAWQHWVLHVTWHVVWRIVIYRKTNLRLIVHSHTHTRTRLTALWPGLPEWAGTRKVKPIWMLLKQDTVSGSGISWAICKSAPRSRQITIYSHS